MDKFTPTLQGHTLCPARTNASPADPNSETWMNYRNKDASKARNCSGRTGFFNKR